MSTNGSPVDQLRDAQLIALLQASPDYERAKRQGKSLENTTPGAAPVASQGNNNTDQNLTTAPDVYRGICQVAKAISREGVAKDQKNQQQGYSFRGIDAIYNALSALLAGAELCILPRMVCRTQEERATAKGGVLFYVVVQADFDFVSCRDGSRHTVTMYGEAMDSADKATNKAMSAAYKYACMQVFCIPTEGMVDADASTPEVITRPSANPRQQDRAAKQAASAGVAERKIDGMQNGKTYEQVSAEERAKLESTQPERLPAWCASMAKIREKFAEIQKRMPAAAYFEILHARGFDNPSQFKNPRSAYECYQILEGWIEAEANPETFEHFQATEGAWQ